MSSPEINRAWSTSCSQLTLSGKTAIQKRRDEISSQLTTIRNRSKPLQEYIKEIGEPVADINVRMRHFHPSSVPVSIYEERARRLQAYENLKSRPAKELASLASEKRALEREESMIYSLKTALSERPVVRQVLDQMHYDGGELESPVCWLSPINTSTSGGNTAIVCFPYCRELKPRTSANQVSDQQGVY